ncbi:hypothetical protein LX36DRAFT_223609 [Colletotrichum falcatum]|nr:hypothetical protein LX36DRAFT_223609 [Colletotrichum falcatum]
MPATDVERLLGELRDPKQQIFISSALEAASHRIPPLLKIFRGLSRDDDADEAKTVYKRNRNMSRIALERDGKKCLLTGAPYPEVCHIFPFASLRYRSTMKTALVSMTTLWGKDRVTELLNRLSSAYAFGDTNMTNVVDTPKNMVTLNPQLHDWWGRGLFALEPLGKPKASDAQSATGTPTTSKKQKREEYTIQVRFHWLRRTDVRDLKSIVDFSQDPIAKLRIPDPNPPAAVNLQTWRPIENGQVFEITANDLEELPDYEILLLQWDLLRMWRLAGGADPAVYSLDDDSDEELGVRGDEKIDEKMEETGGKDGQKDARSNPLPDRPFSSQRRRRTQRSSNTTVDSQPDPSDDACGIRMPTSMAQDPGDDPRSDEEDRI